MILYESVVLMISHRVIYIHIIVFQSFCKQFLCQGMVTVNRYYVLEKSRSEIQTKQTKTRHKNIGEKSEGLGVDLLPMS